MFKRYAYLALFLFVSSCTYFNARTDAAPKRQTITGRVYFMGSEPFTTLGINTFDGRIFALLAEDDKLEEIGELQNEIISIKGYIDKEIKYPQKSVIVEEFKRVDASEVTGSLYKMGKGIRAHYYLQSGEKTYEIITDNSILLEKLLDNVIQVNGYIYEVDYSVDNIYAVSVDKKED